MSFMSSSYNFRYISFDIIQLPMSRDDVQTQHNDFRTVETAMQELADMVLENTRRLDTLVKDTFSSMCVYISSSFASSRHFNICNFFFLPSQGVKMERIFIFSPHFSPIVIYARHDLISFLPEF